MTPTNISTRATEMPSRIEMTLASRANPIQADATNHTFSIGALLPSRRELSGKLEGRRDHAPDRPPGPHQEPSASRGSGGTHPALADSIASDARNVARWLWTVKSQGGEKRTTCLRLPHLIWQSLLSRGSLSTRLGDCKRRAEGGG